MHSELQIFDATQIPIEAEVETAQQHPDQGSLNTYKLISWIGATTLCAVVWACVFQFSF